MKLETFDITNTVTERKCIPILHVKNDGLLTFGAGLTKLLDLKEYSLIKFHHNKESKGDWYLEVVEKDGFVLRKREKSTFCFSNAALVKKIFESIEYHGEGGRITIGEKLEFDGRTLYTLITSRLKDQNN